MSEMGIEGDQNSHNLIDWKASWIRDLHYGHGKAA
jgi:hypothetical protein